MSLDLLAAVRTESARFADVLADLDPATRVRSCPDWDAGDLLWHLTEVHWFWATVVGDRITDGAAVEAAEAGAPTRPATHDDLVVLYDRTTQQLLDALAGADDDTTVWTWAPEQTVGFVRRFQAHEALMHRVDAELAAGALTPLPADLASDGLEVVTRYSHSWRPEWATWTPGDAVGRLRATDTGAEVLVRPGTWGGESPDTGTTYDAEAALEVVEAGAPAFTVSAPAADLDAWLWNRPGFAAVTVEGDRAPADLLEAVVARGVR